MQVRNRIKVQIAIEYAKTFALVFIAIGAFAWLTGKYAEAILFCVAHFALRPCFDKQFHFYDHYACIVLTIGLGMLGVYITLPLHVSFLSSILVVFAICWLGYVVADWMDLRAKQAFSVKQSTRVEFVERCTEKGLREDEIQLCLLLFKSGLRGQDLYKAICYSERQTKNLRKKYLSILE